MLNVLVPVLPVPVLSPREKNTFTFSAPAITNAPLSSVVLVEVAVVEVVVKNVYSLYVRVGPVETGDDTAPKTIDPPTITLKKTKIETIMLNKLDVCFIFFNLLIGSIPHPPTQPITPPQRSISKVGGGERI